MNYIKIKREIIFWVLLTLPLAYILCVWNALPPSIPMQYGFDGTPHRFGGKESVLIIPLINICMYLLLLFIPKIDPKRMNYDFFETNFYNIRLLIVISLMAGSFSVAHSGLIGRLDVSGKIMLAAIFLLLSVLGSFMINLKPNWFIGIRTPWTLSSDTVWAKTHRLGGRIYFFGGLLCLALTFLLPHNWLIPLLLVFILGTGLFLVAYSYRLFQNEQEDAPH